MAVCITTRKIGCCSIGFFPGGLFDILCQALILTTAWHLVAPVPTQVVAFVFIRNGLVHGQLCFAFCYPITHTLVGTVHFVAMSGNKVHFSVPQKCDMVGNSYRSALCYDSNVGLQVGVSGSGTGRLSPLLRRLVLPTIRAACC